MKKRAFHALIDVFIKCLWFFGITLCNMVALAFFEILLLGPTGQVGILISQFVGWLIFAILYFRNKRKSKLDDYEIHDIK